MNAKMDSSLYYDPYDFEIDTNPYPIWKRMRDEAPLYYNEKYDFYALSRYDDVTKCLKDFDTYSSAKGTIMELIKAGFQAPPGMFIFEDPPLHDIHRDILRRLFTPRAIAAVEPKVREFTTQVLDPYVGKGGFDFIKDLGSEMPMRTIGMLLGIPEADQAKIRDYSMEGLDLDESGAPGEDLHFRFNSSDGDPVEVNDLFGTYLDWREQNPSDDLMTQLIQSEFVDETGTTRRLTRDEILGYVRLLAGAGNETTTRLIGWTGKVLADHPEQLAELAKDPSLINNAIDEVLRFEPPSPVQARYVTKDVEHYGQVVPKGSVILLLNASANRDERKFKDPDKFDIRRKIDQTLTFGHGLHFCMGSHLAKLEGRVALQEVLKRFPAWRVDWDKAKQARTSTVRGWDSLPVITDEEKWKQEQNNRQPEEKAVTDTTKAGIDDAWDLVIKAPNGEQKSVVTLKSDGEVLTGSITNPEFGEQPIEGGKYDGETLTWKSKMTKPVKITVTYTATLDGDNNISGHIKAMMAKIPFSGTPVAK